MTETTKARLSPVVYILGFCVSVGSTLGLMYCVAMIVGVEIDTRYYIGAGGLAAFTSAASYGIGALCRGYYIETWDAAIGRLGPVALKNFICVFQDLYDARKRPGADATPDEVRLWNEREFAKKEEA